MLLIGKFLLFLIKVSNKNLFYNKFLTPRHCIFCIYMFLMGYILHIVILKRILKSNNIFEWSGLVLGFMTIYDLGNMTE